MQIIGAMKTIGKSALILPLVIGFRCNGQNCDGFSVSPSDLAPITQVLNLCEPIAKITAPPPATNFFSAQQRTDLTYSLLQAQAGVTDVSLQLTSAQAHLDLVLARIDKHNLNGQQLLQIATAIIGMVGGGVGGGLHLVNDPKVGHAATLIGISAGVAGGSLGLANSFIYPPKPSSVQLGRLLRSYNDAVTHYPLDQLATNPIKLADFLGQVSDKVQVLQEEISRKTTAMRSLNVSPGP